MIPKVVLLGPVKGLLHLTLVAMTWSSESRVYDMIL